MARAAQESEKTQAQDEFDLAAELLEVHSDKAREMGLNKDFVMSSLEKPQARFVREQFRTIVQVGIFLTSEERIRVASQSILLKGGIPKTILNGNRRVHLLKEEKEKIKAARTVTIQAYVNDLSTMAVLSRAEGGRVLLSFLDGIWKVGEKAEQRTRGFLDKLLGRNKEANS